MQTYSEKNVRGWNKEDIVSRAGELFGLELSAGSGKDELVEAFLGAQSGARVESPQRSENGRVRVIFHNQEGPGGSDDIFASVNGRAYLIKREHEIMLPREVMRVIENARQSVFERGEDNRLREKLVKRYSYTLIGEAA